MSEENNLTRDKDGNIAELDLDWEEWQIKILEKLREWFPDESRG